MKRSLFLSVALLQLSCAARTPAYTQEELWRQEPWVCRVLHPRNRGSRDVPPNPTGDALAAVAAIAVVAVAYVVLGSACIVTRLPRLLEPKPAAQS